MAGKFEITKAGDGTFSFELFIDDNAVGKSPVFDKEDACKRGVKAVKKNSRMKVQNTLANDEEKTNPKYLVEAVPIMRQRLLILLKKSATMQMPLPWLWQRLFFPRMSKSRLE